MRWCPGRTQKTAAWPETPEKSHEMAPDTKGRAVPEGEADPSPPLKNPENADLR